eukprot:SAG22_NODE_1477_length_4328_cov_2.451643_5_plen_338_part_00
MLFTPPPRLPEQQQQLPGSRWAPSPSTSSSGAVAACVPAHTGSSRRRAPRTTPGATPPRTPPPQPLARAGTVVKLEYGGGSSEEESRHAEVWSAASPPLPAGPDSELEDLKRSGGGGSSSSSPAHTATGTADAWGTPSGPGRDQLDHSILPPPAALRHQAGGALVQAAAGTPGAAGPGGGSGGRSSSRSGSGDTRPPAAGGELAAAGQAPGTPDLDQEVITQFRRNRMARLVAAAFDGWRLRAGEVAAEYWAPAAARAGQRRQPCRQSEGFYRPAALREPTFIRYQEAGSWQRRRDRRLLQDHLRSAAAGPARKPPPAAGAPAPAPAWFRRWDAFGF